MKLQSEGRVYALMAVLVVLLLVWGYGKSKDIEVEKVAREGAIEKEREIRSEQVRLLRENTAKVESALTAKLEKIEDRNADLLAWLVTTREMLLRYGLKPPSLPESMSDSDNEEE